MVQITIFQNTIRNSSASMPWNSIDDKRKIEIFRIHDLTRKSPFGSFAVVLGEQIGLEPDRVCEVRADVRGRGHRTVSGRLDGAERPDVDATVAVAGIRGPQSVHDEDIHQRVSSLGELPIDYINNNSGNSIFDVATKAIKKKKLTKITRR